MNFKLIKKVHDFFFRKTGFMWIIEKSLMIIK